MQLGSAPYVLPATLTLPKTRNRRVPIVVLVHGSGPNDRDETIGANKPFRDLAWGLAKRGVAVLRYEKRTSRYMSTAVVHTVEEEVLVDARAAIDAATRIDEADPHRVYLLGHSLGGGLVPRIAASRPQLAGAIILAGYARPLHHILAEQMHYLGAPDADAVDRFAAKVDARTIDPDANYYGAPGSYWLDLAAYEPAHAAAALELPLLIIAGGRDFQVSDADLELWRTALAAKKNATFSRHADLNHLMLTGTGKPSPAEYQVKGEVAREVVEEIAAFALHE